MNGPFLSFKNGFWSTRNQQKTVVELGKRDCFVETFAGRGQYCGISILHKSGVRENYQIPFNGGSCELGLPSCDDIVEAQLFGDGRP